MSKYENLWDTKVDLLAELSRDAKRITDGSTTTIQIEIPEPVYEQMRSLVCYAPVDQTGRLIEIWDRVYVDHFGFGYVQSMTVCKRLWWTIHIDGPCGETDCEPSECHLAEP